MPAPRLARKRFLASLVASASAVIAGGVASVSSASAAEAPGRPSSSRREGLPVVARAPRNVARGELS